MSLEDLRSHRADWVEPGLLELSRLRRLGDPAERPGHLRAPDPEPDGGLRRRRASATTRSTTCTSSSRPRSSPSRTAPATTPIPPSPRSPWRWLISKEYARERAKTIDPRRARAPTWAPATRTLDSDTVYLCAADGEGNMVSLIQSNYSGFGSGICPDGVGFAMQNRGQSFSLDPGASQPPRAEEAPVPHDHPGLPDAGSGAPVMAFGVMGGDIQPQGHAQVVMNILDFGLSVQQATDVPRIAHDGSSAPWGGRDDGRRRGRSPSSASIPRCSRASPPAATGSRQTPEALGGYQAIWREENPRRYFGGSDPRKDGRGDRVLRTTQRPPFRDSPGRPDTLRREAGRPRAIRGAARGWRGAATPAPRGAPGPSSAAPSGRPER